MLFLTLYGGAAATALLLCLYLSLSKVNVIAPGVEPPVALRRWAAAFLGAAAAGHVYWLLAYANGFDEHSSLYAPLTVLDSVTLLITLFGTMLSMLQDRRRPLRPFVAALMPVLILGVLQMVWSDIDFVPPIIVYTLLLYTFFTIYMTNAVRQYQRWLRDHYADLEHKEVWASHTLLIVVLLLLINYGFAEDGPAILVVRLTDFVLFGLLLWRVETLPLLEEASEQEEDLLPEQDILPEPDFLPLQPDVLPEPIQETVVEQQKKAIGEAIRAGVLPRIGQLLEKKCVDTELYLQQDLTLTQLSAIVGVNRYYLGQYFASQGMNYNNYINGLRINHFTRLYEETIATKQPATAQQLALQCGYRSYSTFSLAFKQRMGQSVTSWMRDVALKGKNCED